MAKITKKCQKSRKNVHHENTWGCHLYCMSLYMLWAFKKKTNQHLIKLFRALKVFADMRHKGSYIRCKYAIFGIFWRFFHVLWFQITLRRSSVIVRGPPATEISTEHFGVLNINSWKIDVLSLPTICGHFFDFWCSQNTIFGQKIWKICGCRNFWRSLKCFLTGPRIWKYFWKIYSLSI